MLPSVVQDETSSHDLQQAEFIKELVMTYDDDSITIDKALEIQKGIKFKLTYSIIDSYANILKRKKKMKF
jgi:hypothetical protein